MLTPYLYPRGGQREVVVKFEMQMKCVGGFGAEQAGLGVGVSFPLKSSIQHAVNAC